MLNIVIVGGGATGVELAAELHRATHQLASYGLDQIDPDRDVRMSVIEAAPRLLPALPERLSQATEAELRHLGIDVLAGEQVSQVTGTGIHTHQGRFIPAELKVWCAGIKTPEVSRHLDGLEIDRMGRVIVDEHLQAKGDPAIYAFGDCAAAIPVGGDKPVAPRAQAAYQQAQILEQTIERRHDGLPSRSSTKTTAR